MNDLQFMLFVSQRSYQGAEYSDAELRLVSLLTKASIN